MLIESITPVTKERSRVKLEDGETFVLYKGELRILKLKEQSDLAPEIYNQIMTVILPKRAKLRAMNLLKTKAYTEYQLRKKLSEGGYPDSVTDVAVEYVKSYGYVNDKAYALEYIRLESSNRSKKELYLKLSQKGIGKEILDAAFEEVYGSFKDARDVSYDSEKDVVLRTLKKRGYRKDFSYEERQKMLAYFYRRGFDMDLVYNAMDDFDF